MQRIGALLRGPEGTETLHRRLAEVRALERWPDLVGPLLAKRTRPLQLAGDRLLVVAHGSALRQELTFHKQAILGKFNEAAGRRVAREIVFLESDANLSSLVEGGTGEAEVEPPARVGRPEPDDPEAPDSDDEPAGAAYDTFDAVAYRKELARIAGR